MERLISPLLLPWRCETCDRRSFKPAWIGQEEHARSAAIGNTLLNKAGRLFGVDSEPYEGE